MSDEQYDDSSVADLPLWSNTEANNRLADVCNKYNVPIGVITDLVSLQRERQHQERAAGIYARIEEILGSMD
ncbi:DNA modification system-associated small protein [Paraburkholderia heleia]|uniref:DNA modification system-associated small protein n=1 Tax=Paraburkholderia heleia TaxID=634127 RepID=UPI0005A92E4E|nr:DNA modification system-associated small protein [Paraburkholderia heleia]